MELNETAVAPALAPLHQRALDNFDKLPDSAGVPVQVVAALMTCSVATVWRRAASKRLPTPIQHGGTTRWLAGDLRKALRGGQ
ncbi:MAG: transcriptional regulator [Burkholderiaceae bacterium]